MEQSKQFAAYSLTHGIRSDNNDAANPQRTDFRAEAGPPATSGGRYRALAPTTALVVAVLLVAANLRPAVTSLGPVLDEVRRSVGASATWASVVTALPGLCFGLAAFLAPVLARRAGMPRAVAYGVLLIGVGVVARVLDGPGMVLIGTFAACVGIAVCNVLIPVVVREFYPQRVGLITGLYTATMQAMAALAAALTPQLDAVFGGWRPALGVWALLALAGLLAWAVAARRGGTGPAARLARPPGKPASGRTSVLRSPVAWLVTGFFGLQAFFAYAMINWVPQVLMDTAGLDRATAGVMAGVINVIGVPISLVVAPLAARQRSQSKWVAALGVFGGVGLIGLLVAPSAAPWLWSLCLGIGMGVFPIAIALISLRTRSSADTRGLSTMAQGCGYLLAAVGPLMVGVLHGATGGWTVSLVVLLIVVGVQVVVGVLAGRPRYV